MNIDVLSEIVSYLDITTDEKTLNDVKEANNLTVNETNMIKEYWVANSKYECKKSADAVSWWLNGKLHRDGDLPAIEFYKWIKIVVC